MECAPFHHAQFLNSGKCDAGFENTAFCRGDISPRTGVAESQDILRIIIFSLLNQRLSCRLAEFC